MFRERCVFFFLRFEVFYGFCFGKSSVLFREFFREGRKFRNCFFFVDCFRGYFRSFEFVFDGGLRNGVGYGYIFGKLV